MRLLTRSDFDGLACGVFLVEKGIVDEYKFVHPKDIQDGKIEVTSNDVLANVPYVSGCGLWFDHHTSESERLEIENLDFEGETRPAPSCAQVIWDYYGGEESFGKDLLPQLEAVNKSDSGNLTREEVLNPKGWVLLSFIMDPRTGLGRFGDYRISNYQLMEEMVQYCRTKTVDEILQIPDVQERVKLYFDQQDLFKDMLNRCCMVKDNVIITNLINEETVYSGNRFLVYALFPNQNIEIRVIWGKSKQNVVFTVGHSILNRTSRTNVGKLMLTYGGGGHEKVGTCQVPIEDWERRMGEIVDQMRKDG
ncbi:MAG: exopolyphosphatase [Deltaproteobacteria bacterium]|uniref:Exopolyphosphatase n=1 Tax=Candidatus Desulfacyla euxinica TaxID=2841693 RepID=A0A8J6MVI0_9DELT|nr:exopolyphosphatase [Candidatus Desulfacyla euxinica]MBL7216583.1 exopolyphosphatase [Desulfobacteraceae bacterium]